MGFIVSHQLTTITQSALLYPVILDIVPTSMSASDLAIMLSLLQSLMLGILVFALNDGKFSAVRWAIVIGTFVTMLAVAGLDHILKSADLYAYAGYVKLGIAAYDPPSLPFAGSYRVINVFWGLPITPCLYGPVWLALVHAATEPAQSLAAKIFALRSLSAAAFVLCALCLTVAKQERLAFAAFALNPAIFEQYIVDGHNDLIAIAFILCATLVVGSPHLRILLFALAICVKLPFALVGAVVFTDVRDARRRLVLTACGIALGLTTTVVLVGPAYAKALFGEITRRPQPDAWVALGHVVCLGVALAAIAGALFLRRFSPGAALPFAGIALLPFPWYAIWCIPYAGRAGVLVPLLIALPLLTGFFSSTYEPTAIRTLLGAVLVLAALASSFVSLWRTRALTVSQSQDELFSEP